MSNHLRGKVVVITGAASGFGKLVSEKLTSAGACLVAGDINKSALDDVVDSLATTEAQITGMQVDVTVRSEMQALIRHAQDTFGRVDVMINNAGVMPLAFFRDHEAAHDAWDRCIDINFKGVLNGIAAAHDVMIKQGRGHIVNVSSIYGNYPVVGGGVYGATKAAVTFLSESLRQESLGKIKVTTVKPTGVPATALGTGVVNPQAIAGILGANAQAYMGKFAASAGDGLSQAELDSNNVQYWALAPEHLAEQIVYVINQPWGVSIAEITVRATGDAYVI
ncbi:MAG: SDR family oxidoreductase [bacterium]